MQLEAVESSIIAFRGHDAASETMQIVFKSRSTGQPTSHYLYRFVSAELYSKGCAEDSFGSWFQRQIKPLDVTFPFEKLADQYIPDSQPSAQSSIHLVQPAEVITEAPAAPATEDELKTQTDELVSKALALAPGKTKAELLAGTVAISIATPQDRERVVTMALALAAMRKGVAGVYDPKIAEENRKHKQAIADKNLLDKPLAAFEEVARKAIGSYDAEVKRAEVEAAKRIREEEQRKADEEARKQAEENKLNDAIEAEQSGDHEAAAQIISAPIEPVQGRYVAPINIPSSIPKGSGIDTSMVPDFEIVNVDKIPREYLIPNEKAIRARVTTLGLRAFNSEEHGIHVSMKPVVRRNGAKGRIA